MPKNRRKPLRLKCYDYRQPGYYFVTFCSFERECIFGKIVGTEFLLSEIGGKISELWHWLPEHFLNVSLDVMQVMPNHVHAIVIIEEDFHDPGKDEQPFKGQASIGQIVGYWKYMVSKQLSAKDRGIELWQDNMWEHIVRHERELGLIREYITNNPGAWAEDQENPVNAGKMRSLTNAEIADMLVTSPPGAGTAPLQGQGVSLNRAD